MILTVNEFKGLFAAWSKTMTENRDYLIDLDSIVGDGDLGLTMADGFAAASNYAQSCENTDLGNLFYFAGKTMATAVPSTMGTLMASGLMEVGKTLKTKTQLSANEAYLIFEAYENGVMLRGKAKVGEKTFLDGLDPAIKVLKAASADSDMAAVWADAASAAAQGAQNTTTMLAVHGRAATRGEQSRSLLDPGAVVAKMLVETACSYFSDIL
ncbi:DAK2 domain-containing protein [Oscillospiraceae bacterium PP1C4]